MRSRDGEGGDYSFLIDDLLLFQVDGEGGIVEFVGALGDDDCVDKICDYLVGGGAVRYDFEGADGTRDIFSVDSVDLDELEVA